MRINILIFFTMLLLLVSCDKKSKEQKEIHENHEMNHASKADTSKNISYWCPMDTQIVQNAPGICPICEMDLEVKTAINNRDSLSNQEWVYTPVNVAVLSTVKSIKPTQGTIPVKIKARGYITYDERRINNISARIAGRIENLRVKYNYQPILKGKALFEIFSHELQTAQQEYLYLKRNDPDNVDLNNAAKRKLLLLGVTEDQLKHIKEGGHIHPTTTVYSSYSGYVVELEDNKEPFRSDTDNSMNSDGMKNNNSMSEKNKELNLREGAYVEKGENVLSVVNTDVVWGILEIYSNQLTNVKLNQMVHIIPDGTDEMIMGKINFIEPAYREGSGTVRLRVYLDNQNQNLKIGNLLSAEIEAGNKQGLMIPQTSMYDLGRDKIVFVKRNGAFETRKVTIGFTEDNEVEILSGLVEGEEIAENAQFMIDSESFVKVSK